MQIFSVTLLFAFEFIVFLCLTLINIHLHFTFYYICPFKSDDSKSKKILLSKPLVEVLVGEKVIVVLDCEF